MLDNQRMTDGRSQRESQQSLLLAALGRTLAAAAAAVTDPKLAELLATGLAQHQQLAAGHVGPEVDRAPAALRDGTGPWVATISGLDEDRYVRRATALEARCAIDSTALLEGLRAWDCRCDCCDRSNPHGTLVDDDGCITALFEIAREER
jgi:hypothetical protein